MEYVYYHDLKLSRFCMGGCPMGGHGWGDTQEQGFLDAIHEALDQGVNFFDTADTYGLGQSEITLAKGLGDRRKDVVIQSKFGVRVMQDMIGKRTIYDNSPDYIRKALEGTLMRLNTDYIDIYTIHYRDKDTPIDLVMETLERLKKEGKVRYFGISNIHGADVEELRPYRSKYATCQEEFSLACRKNEADLNLIRDELGALPMTWGSLGQGILTGKYNATVSFGENDRRRRNAYVNFHGEKLMNNLEIVKVMSPIAQTHGKTCAATAIRFILDFIDHSIVTVGVKDVHQMKSNLEGIGWHLSAEEIETLERVSRD